ncbi:MAG: CcoQ/FixQ family Cbb3-type cytochrome c oxidase assembly chaperone [Bacteroidetes bacterium]|nr:MAG: CcoQ/FixQ family Cbb3-type cytochrome c oxidase assembly chaperone [Bacteroidota bacterium]
MLKFIKHHLETITGIEIFPLISFIIFFLFFVIVTLLVFKKDKKFIEHMRNLPLDND